MKTVDFSRSFLTFRIDTEKKPSKTGSHKPPFTLNNARIQIDCRCRIEDRETGSLQSFVMGASCKTERVGVEADIWTEPNADFVPILSDDRFMNIKTFARYGMEVPLYPPGSGIQSDRQTGMCADVFDSIRIEAIECEGELLDSPSAVVEATLAGRTLTARTEIEQEQYRAVIEYPVKTMNANERDGIYQTDTGPIIFPDLTRKPDDLMAGLEMAFSAFNRADWIELLIRVPTQVSEGVQVYHYSRPVRCDAKNSLYSLSDASS
jgi:hypothetical protein